MAKKFNPVAPVTGDPTKPKTNVAVKNDDGTVTLNNQATFTKEGQDVIFRKKYEFDKESPYLGKYGSLYADDDGFETKGANIVSYKDGLINFNNKYNIDDQQRYIDKIRALPQNKGRQIYLAGSTDPHYMAPRGYSGKITKTFNPSAPIK